MHQEFRVPSKRRGRVVAGTLIAGLLVAGCSVGDRQRNADRIHETRQRAVEGAAVLGSITYQLRYHPASRAEAATLTGVATPAELALRAEVVVDAVKGRSEVRFGRDDLPKAEQAEAALSSETPPEAPAPSAGPPAEPASKPVAAIFDRSTVFIKRQSLRPTERRTWAKLDFDRLTDNEPRPSQEDLAGNASLVALATTVNPAHVVDMATGALAGSARVKGPVDIDGTPTTHYTANISLEKSMEEIDLTEEEVETRTLTHRLLAFRDDIVPAEFWIAEDGSLRRMTVRIPQRVTRRRADRLVITLDLQGPAPAAVAGDPTGEETVTYQRYGRLLRAAQPAPV